MTYYKNKVLHLSLVYASALGGGNLVVEGLGLQCAVHTPPCVSVHLDSWLGLRTQMILVEQEVKL